MSNYYPDFKSIYEKAGDMISEFPPIKKRRQISLFYRIIKYFSLFVLLVVFILIIAVGIEFNNYNIAVKSALEGKGNLESSLYLIKTEDFGSAMETAKRAQENFSLSQKTFANISDNFYVVRLPYIRTQFQYIDYLLSTAELLSRSVAEGSAFGKELKDVISGKKATSFTSFTQDEKRLFLEKIYKSAPELTEMKKNLDLAYANLENVKTNGILFPIASKIKDLKDKVAQGREFLGKSIPMSKILPSIAGFPKTANYLIAIENSDELRPTGGFIGTYGIASIEYGEILRFDTHDIYHVDMPVKDAFKIEPPYAIKKHLVPNWYMRDANWSPDWPTSAEKLIWFYDNENKLLPPKDQINNFTGEFDGVIAITPEFITDLLHITGPIMLNNEIYDETNFTKLLQYKVEKGYEQLGVSSWQRKEIIGDIMKELKIRIFDMPSDRWQEIIDVMDKNVLRKNILVYVKNKEIEALIAKEKWTGEIEATTGDYLMAIDANFGALKTDAVMKRSIDYKVEKKDNGMFAKLRLNYANNGTEDWRTTTYKTYTRIFVPLGSKLIKSVGGETEVREEKENDKQVFGTYFRVAPGKIGSLYFEYKLPDRFYNQSNYKLIVEKQPGKTIDELKVDVNVGNDVKSYSPHGLPGSVNEYKTGVSWDTDLLADKVFEVRY